MQQLHDMSKLPFIHKHIAVMPDCHWGNGTTVGSVIPTIKAIVPAAVGVDLGCGMMAQQLAITAKDLPDSLGPLRSAMEAAIPHGRTDNGRSSDRGAWGTLPTTIAIAWDKLILRDDIQIPLARHPKLFALHTEDSGARQLGTLGTGNHFVEICLDKDGAVWVMLHSGSRGIGNRIGTYFIERAKELCARYHVSLPEPNLAFIPEADPIFNDYWRALKWAQDYALVNRQIMMERALATMEKVLGFALIRGLSAVNCHHNYVEKEHHYGSNVFVTRKGAVRARAGDLGIIPGSMGARSFIVRGLGNAESFDSCSHGAGRSMSRTEARRRFSTADLAEQTQGVECRKDADVVDEIPGAYKSIEEVMANQSDLVEKVAELRQVLCIKG